MECVMISNIMEASRPRRLWIQKEREKKRERKRKRERLEKVTTQISKMK